MATTSPAAAAAATAAVTTTRKLTGYDFYRRVLKSAKHIVAPMVDQSEHTWRLLSARYGSHMAYTPMLHARLFSENAEYRSEFFSTSEEDRPLIAQFCANDPETLLRAAKLIEDQCDAVDINLGCPQGIAKRGHYGSFLMEEWDLIYKLVNVLHENLAVPVTCKIRVYPEVEKTVEYAKMLEKAGCQLLTVHGRLREQKGHNTGMADWSKIKAVKEAVSIPVFANGNILYYEDIQKCIDATGVDGVMSAEGNLYNPAIFGNIHPPVWQMAEEYLALCRQYPTPPSMVRGHLFKIFRSCINDYPDQRDQLAKAVKMDQFESVTAQLRAVLEPIAQASSWDVTVPSSEIPNDANGYKKLPSWVCQPYMRDPMEVAAKQAQDAVAEPREDDAVLTPEEREAKLAEEAQRREELVKARQERKLAKRKRKEVQKEREAVTKKTSGRGVSCTKCFNISSIKCAQGLCKNCCSETLKQNAIGLHARGITIDAMKDQAVVEDLQVECPAHGKGWKLMVPYSAAQPDATAMPAEAAPAEPAQA
ncbi:hypothetical protein AMAG_03618 [Allomyces macrogynus ATCC 38327]|uniref:tRNA-dihydrouridine(16/17) synthase [NAD(P)(+)] n=1 Tax=Allomyces macrogynus (strain ATCC 38327) TaxID=578462 RepID=A0A0L0SA53_ALLM3|nr:hypothetical protein AMAG_03618 [Allomyces macrogynus ATCC 38327]|eukprot:KNE59317.1 hypothetical protein AMAG_03618 [Allomyces macrogynus ATCC 38327]